MDDLDQREAFLLAIFAAPDDDLPRLVFADWLEERGEGEWANRIRTQCHLFRQGRRIAGRGFRIVERIHATADQLAAPDDLRRTAILHHPEWYGCDELKVSGGKIAGSKPINTILNNPVTQRVTKLDLSGAEVVHAVSDVTGELIGDFFPLHDFEYGPTVSLQAVEALVAARECRRFTHLDLTNNDLDNDAARAILRSNYLTRLESLKLFQGNQLRGRTWAALQEKFGEGVLS
jgi:uncharacterized protein (TIGR02996 family)